MGIPQDVVLTFCAGSVPPCRPLSLSVTTSSDELCVLNGLSDDSAVVVPVMDSDSSQSAEMPLQILCNTSEQSTDAITHQVSRCIAIHSKTCYANCMQSLVCIKLSVPV